MYEQQHEELMMVFGSAAIIVANLSSGYGKKIIVNIHFLKNEIFVTKNVANPHFGNFIFSKLHFRRFLCFKVPNLQEVSFNRGIF